jgi:hypothetical protein
MSETESKTASGLARNTSHASYPTTMNKGYIAVINMRLDLPRRLSMYAQSSPYYQTVSEGKEFQ